MLFKIIRDKTVSELNPEILVIEEFANLTDRQLKYTILSTDYKSPFRKLTKEDKKFRAALEAGYKLEKGGKRLDMNGRNIVQGKNPEVEKAIKKYKILQKDEDYETLLGISKLIADIREFTARVGKETTEIEKAIKFAKELPALLKVKKEIEDTLGMREDEITDVEEVKITTEETPTNLSELAQINDEYSND